MNETFEKENSHLHGPENAEHEVRKAYNCVIEAAVTHLWERKSIPGVNPNEPTELYQKSFQSLRKGNRLAAERWARTAKHLSRAFWHEAKIAYLEPRTADLPYLKGADQEEYHLHERSDTTADLLNSVSDHIPPGQDEMPSEMKHYLSRARQHLSTLEDLNYKHELLRAERIKAAHEYGRVLECMALAFEAENPKRQAAA